MFQSLLASLILTQAPATPPVIALNGGFFVITEGTVVTKVNTKQWAKPRETAFALKDRKSTLSWDAKGLTVKTGTQVRTTKFADLPTLAKFFTPDEIQSYRSQLASKEVKADAVALSGWERVGEILYLVPRWETKAKKTWLEMIVRVDLNKPSPWIEPMAVVDGFSTAKLAVEDHLIRTPGGVGMVAERDGEWGFSFWGMKDPATTFRAIGQFPRLFDVNADGTVLRFIEKTSYGTQLAGMAKLPTGERSDLAENRDPMHFPGDTAEIVQISSPKSVTLRNTESGLELKLPASVGVRNVPPGVLVWVPRENPTQAVLYSRAGLRAIARWSKPTTKPTPPAPRL